MFDTELIKKLENAHFSGFVMNGTGKEKFEAHVLLLEAAEAIKSLHNEILKHVDQTERGTP